MPTSKILILLALFLFACQSDQTASDPPENSPTTENVSGAWTKIEPGGETRCAHDTPYAFWVRPGSSNEILIYFQGGGGCYNAETCGTSGSYKEEVKDTDNPEFTIGGVFDLDNPENPFKDDTMVFVPYCTGDVHSGNRVATYTLASDKSFDIYHLGVINAQSALDWLYANVETPDSIFVTGCSAGSIGSILHVPHVIEQYPETAVIQLGDSAGGLTSVIEWNIAGDYDAGDYFPDWIPSMQDEVAQSFTISKFTNAVANFYPNYTFAQYNPANDGTQKRYFVADGGQADDFSAALQTSLNEIHDSSRNFRSYTAAGEHHCILKTASFYTEETDGVRLRDWVADLSNQIEVDRIQCTDC